MANTKDNKTQEENTDLSWMKESMSEIVYLLTKNQDQKLTADFFNCMFTPSEMKDFASRWQLVKELDKGTTQREIAKKYGMSLCKITRGSRELKKDESAFRRLLEMLANSSN